MTDEQRTARRIRRRWAKAAWIYGFMTALGCLLLGTFVVAIVASLKDNPLEYPFRFSFAQIKPINWVAAWKLGNRGAGDPWLGGFAPGADIDFEVTYFVPEGRDKPNPKVSVPKRRSGSRMGAVSQQEHATDYAVVSAIQEKETRSGVYEEQSGTFVSYGFKVTYPGEGPLIEKLPLNITIRDRKLKVVDSSLGGNRIERRGRVASWENITPGVIGYVFRNYVRTFNEAQSLETGRSLFLTWTMNSFVLGFAKVVLTLLLSSMAGYALARMEFPGKTGLFALVLVSLTVPVQVRFISNYLVLKDLNMLNSMWGMIFSGVDGGGFVGIPQVFIFKQFFENLPRSLEEASFLDGATPIDTFFRIILPLAGPAMGAVTIITFQTVWNEFFWSLVVLTSPQDVYTLPIGLLSFRNAYGVAGDWGLILAGAFLSMIPIVILFVIFQRYFVEGIASTGVKG